MRLNILLLVVSVFSFCYAYSDEEAQKPLSSYRFQNITLSDGLPALEVTRVFQQRNGFVWFGTSRGASRFDGYRYVNYSYQSDENSRISSNYVTDITEDSLGHLWIATEDGLNRITPQGEITTFRAKDGLPSSWIVSMLYDGKGTLWVSTGDAAVTIDTQTDQITALNTNDEIINKLVKLEDGRLVGTYDNKLLWLNSEQDQPPLLFDDKVSSVLDDNENIAAIAQLADGSIAITSEKAGLVIIPLDDQPIVQLTAADGLMSNYGESLLELPDGRLLLGHYDSGISIVDRSTMSVEGITKTDFDPQSVASNTIRHMTLDQNNILWIATENGVSRTSMFSNYQYFYASPNQTGLSSENVISSLLWDDQSLLVLTPNSIDRVKLNSGLIERNILNKVDQRQNEKKYWGMAKDGDHLWLAGATGLSRWNLVTNEFADFSNANNNPYKLPNSDIYTLLPDGKGNVWITGYDNVGLSLFDPDKGIIRQHMNAYRDPYRYDGNFTQHKIWGSDGHIWMATTDGVFRVHPESGAFKHIKLGNQQEYIRASSLSEDKDGNFWVSTEGAGLAKIRLISNEQIDIDYFDTRDGLPSNQLMSLSVNNDDIWIFSIRELVRFNKVNKTAVVYRNIFKVPNLSFNRATTYINDEQLTVGSNKGLFKIALAEIALSNYQPPVVFSEISANNQTYYSLAASQGLMLESGDIKFSFAALDFSFSKSKRYKYRLKNYHTDWQETNSSMVTLTNLAPGNYEFELIGSNSDGLWSKHIARYEFSVARPLTDYLLWLLTILLVTLVSLWLYSRRKQITSLNRQVRVDTLTNLPNRLAFNEQLSSSLKMKKSVFALAIIDLDSFKDINDIHGHAVGDQFLQEVGIRLQSSTKNTDYIARLSGDEFVLIIYRFSNEQNLISILERVRNRLSEPYLIDDIDIKGSASVGIAMFPRDGTNRKELFSHADSAMYHAKKLGKNQIFFFNEELRHNLARRISIKANLESALNNNEFELFYQPKIHYKSKQIIGCEALIRWNHGKDEMIPPSQFIPEAEKNGFIVHIGRWVLEQACQDYLKIKQQIPSLESISVNVSPRQLSKQQFLSDVQSTLSQNAIESGGIELEITEYSLMDESNETRDLLNELKTHGVSIALDDFGTGYSSLSYLAKYPIDTLKIDRSIIDRAVNGSSSLKVLKNIFLLADSLNIQVVTEGVETEQQLALLGDYPDSLVQGYFYSKPLPLDEFLQFARTFNQ